MRPNSSSAFLTSLILHGFVAALIFVTTIYVAQRAKEMPVVFELVAGPPTAPDELVAPALGNSATATKLDVPKVNLPTESKRAQTKPPTDTEFQVIAIDRSGKFYFGAKPVSFAELSSNLGALAVRPKPPVIRVRADLTLQWQQVVRLMDEIKKHNLTKITFDTESK